MARRQRLRDQPIRFRKSLPDCWIGLELIEGKNLQVRCMTAAIGGPTLRLIRVRIGGWYGAKRLGLRQSSGAFPLGPGAGGSPLRPKTVLDRNFRRA